MGKDHRVGIRDPESMFNGSLEVESSAQRIILMIHRHAGATVAIERAVALCGTLNLAHACDGRSEEFGTFDPTIFTCNVLWGDAMLVRAMRHGAVGEQHADDCRMAVGSCKVKWSGARGAHDRGGYVAVAIRVPSRQSETAQSQSEMETMDWCAYEPHCIDVCTMVDEETDDEVVAAGTCHMQGKDAIEDRVDGLAMREGILHKPDVARCRGCVQAEIWDCQEGLIS